MTSNKRLQEIIESAFVCPRMYGGVDREYLFLGNNTALSDYPIRVLHLPNYDANAFNVGFFTTIPDECRDEMRDRWSQLGEVTEREAVNLKYTIRDIYDGDWEAMITPKVSLQASNHPLTVFLA